MNYTGQSLARTLRDAACQVFLNTLDQVDGVKDLVLCDSILVQLDTICGMQKLRQNAVDKVFKLSSSDLTSSSGSKNRVYVIRPSIDQVRLVAKQINDYIENGDDSVGFGVDFKFWIIFVPKFVHYCDIALEEEGVYEYVSVLECPLGLIPLEYDVYSLEDENIFKTLFLSRDVTPLQGIVDSILQLQILSGNIIDVHGQGRFAKIVADKLDQANIADDSNATNISDDGISRGFKGLNFSEDKIDKKDSPSFTDIYLFDRESDYAATLLSQLNYEGILDEAYNLVCNRLEFESNDDKEGRSQTKHSLANDNDPIYRDIRDKHFSTVFSLLKTKNQENQEKFSRSQSMNLSNLKSFVANELMVVKSEIKCLRIHISACEEIMKERKKYDFLDLLKVEQNIIDGDDIRKSLDYITKLIHHMLDPHIPLRLLSLLSLTQGGLPPKDYKKYHSDYCAAFGLDNNLTFDNLRKLGLITEMNLSFNALASGFVSSNSNGPPKAQAPTSTSSLYWAMSSLTEMASGRVAAVVSSSVLPRRGNLSVMLKKFQLVPEESDAGYNIRDPKDPAFVFGGTYIPLICQIIDNCVLNCPQINQKKNTQSAMTPSELMKLLPGPNFKRKQAFLNHLPPGPTLNDKQSDRSILVYFIGGVTFAEITALRFLAKRRNIRLAIATTSIINGNKLIDSMLPADKRKLIKYRKL